MSNKFETVAADSGDQFEMSRGWEKAGRRGLLRMSGTLFGTCGGDGAATGTVRFIFTFFVMHVQAPGGTGACTAVITQRRRLQAASPRRRAPAQL